MKITLFQRYETIRSWIFACTTKEQIAVTHDAVIMMFDKLYNQAGSQLSESLHSMCIQRAEYYDSIDPLNEVVAGKD